MNHSENRTTITIKERTTSVGDAVTQMVKSERNGGFISSINWQQPDITMICNFAVLDKFDKN